MHTRNGIRFDLLAPTTDMVRRDDIEHALARINRFSGHTAEPYSVATHSLLVADILALWGCPPPIVREGLLHDAPEAYYGDITSPVKATLRAVVALWYNEPPGPLAGRDTLSDPLARLTCPIDLVVRDALVLPVAESAIVKRADLVALAIERRDLFGQPEMEWSLPEYADTRLSARRGQHHSTEHDRFAERWRKLDEACGVSR